MRIGGERFRNRIRTAEADSFQGAQGATAGGQSHFVGTFLGSGLLTLRLDLADLNSLIGGAASSGTLFVLVSSTVGTTISGDLATRAIPSPRR